MIDGIRVYSAYAHASILDDQQYVRYEDYLAALSAQPSPGGQDALFAEELAELRRLVPSVNQKQALDAAIAALAARQPVGEPVGVATVVHSKHFDKTQCTFMRSNVPEGTKLYAAPPAHPSPGGQDALATARELLSAEYDKAGEKVFADRARKGRYDNDPDVRAIVAALAARQPSKQPDSVALGEATEFCIEKGNRQPAGEPITVEAVAIVRRWSNGDRYIDWLTEGGIADLEVGDVLMVSDRAITDEDGSGEVYAAPPAQAVSNAIDMGYWGGPHIGLMLNKDWPEHSGRVYLGAPAQAVDLGELREMLVGWKNSDYPLSYEGQCAQRALDACVADLQGWLDSLAVGNG
ncbi:TPA: hypothetical protein UM515_000703 [Stenotrophomonas maltophilia]|nr:hypothetical protein [Stenotrophomonas maltophilia]